MPDLRDGCSFGGWQESVFLDTTLGASVRITAKRYHQDIGYFYIEVAGLSQGESTPPRRCSSIHPEPPGPDNYQAPCREYTPLPTRRLLLSLPV